LQLLGGDGHFFEGENGFRVSVSKAVLVDHIEGVLDEFLSVRKAKGVEEVWEVFVDGDPIPEIDEPPFGQMRWQV